MQRNNFPFHMPYRQQSKEKEKGNAKETRQRNTLERTGTLAA